MFTMHQTEIPLTQLIEEYTQTKETVQEVIILEKHIDQFYQLLEDLSKLAVGENMDFQLATWLLNKGYLTAEELRNRPFIYELDCSDVFGPILKLQEVVEKDATAEDEEDNQPQWVQDMLDGNGDTDA